MISNGQERDVRQDACIHYKIKYMALKFKFSKILLLFSTSSLSTIFSLSIINKITK